MIYDSPNWRVIRRIGVGDREHVRGRLLSVGCFTHRHLLYAIEAVFKAGVELDMMTRVHYNFAREHPVINEQIARLVHRFCQHDAQLIEHGFLDEVRFQRVFESCDLLVTPKSEPNLNIDAYIDELVELVKFAWRSSGERFLAGNFSRWTDDELRIMYPTLWPDHQPFYQDFCSVGLVTSNG